VFSRVIAATEGVSRWNTRGNPIPPTVRDTSK
jgi:hypothetical protein